MSTAHLFNTHTMDWTAHERFPVVRAKVLEMRETHPWASVMLVGLDVDGAIDPHSHPKETETVYVLAGQGLLTHGEEETTVGAGMGASIPPGLRHSLRNIGPVPLELLAIHMPPIR